MPKSEGMWWLILTQLVIPKSKELKWLFFNPINRFSTQNGPRLGHSLRNGGRAVHKLLFQQRFSVMFPWRSGLRRWTWGILDLLPQVQDPRPAKIARRFLGFWSHLATVLTSKMKFLAMVSICPALFGHIFAVSAFLVILLDSSG